MPINMSNVLHKKRAGTSGVSGQLYETKLLSLILFRLLHDEDIEEFYIGTNMDGLGEFDDICFRFKAKGFDKPIAVFLQAKHRNNQNRPLTVSKTDLKNYFKSYINIRNKFNVNSSDAFFKCAYEDVECAFVFYTNRRDELGRTYHRMNYINKINNVISTGDEPFQLSYTEDDTKVLNKMVSRGIIDELAKLIADIVRVKRRHYENLMNNELIQTYHVILSQHVFNFKDVNTDYRLARIKTNIFDTTDEYLQLLRNGLLNEALKDKPALRSRSKLINTIFTTDNHNTLEKYENIQYTDLYWHEDKDEYLNAVLEDLELRINSARAAIEQAMQAVYCSEWFQLPAAFGNRDLTLRGSRKEKRLFYLAKKFIDLLKESNGNIVNKDPLNIIRIDDNFPDKGFLRLNGGIAGAVGNLLIFDNKTRLLMFQDGNNLEGHAKTMFDKINSEIKELEKYRFDVRVKNFPKLSFDCNEHDKSMVLDFTNRLLFCTNQARESEVEHILKRDIYELHNTRERCNFEVNPDAIFVTFHQQIQKWWMQPKNAGYLTKETPIYQYAMEGSIEKPLLSIANVINKNGISSTGIKFTTSIINSLEFNKWSNLITIIVSEVIDLSVAKFSQYLMDEHYLIDLNYILSLPGNDRKQLDAELLSVKDKTFILTCKSFTRVPETYEGIRDVLLKLNGNKRIVVTSEKSAGYFRDILYSFEIEIGVDKSNLLDLTQESQDVVFENTKVMFQGQKVSLKVLFRRHDKAHTLDEPSTSGARVEHDFA